MPEAPLPSHRQSSQSVGSCAVSDTVPEAYVELDREQWRGLRENTPLTLTAAELETLRGVEDPIDLAEVTDIYLPLTRLLNLHFTGVRLRGAAVRTFLGDDHA